MLEMLRWKEGTEGRGKGFVGRLYLGNNMREYAATATMFQTA